MAYKDRKSTKIKSTLLLLILRFVYWLPATIPYWIGRFFAKINLLMNAKTTRIIRTNLQICYPDLSEKQINERIKQFNQQNTYLTSELATAWFANRETITTKISQVHHQELIDETLASQKPLILAVPHIGNWEYLWQWLQLNYAAIGMYQPAKFKQLGEAVLTARTKFDGRAFSTNPKGIMGLLRALKNQGVMMILPDQAPRAGAGIYTPFYGYPAYTMTLLHKFINKTEARLLFASCIREKDGKRFQIYLEKANFDYIDKTVEDFNCQMNLQIESIINQWPEQYQWSYKRFKRQPGKENPYL